MTIQPDPNESIWYSLQQKLSIDPNMIPHYYSIIIREFQLFDEQSKKEICMICNTHDVFKYKNKWYCQNDYEPIIGTKKNEEYIKGVNKINLNIEGKNNPDHKIILETPNQTIRRITSFIKELLTEPNGSKMDLVDIETVIFGQQDDMYFETKNGDINKATVIKYLNHIVNFINSEMVLLKHKIRFMSVMSSPPIRVG